jgi:hypothetical protein
MRLFICIHSLLPPHRLLLRLFCLSKPSKYTVLTPHRIRACRRDTSNHICACNTLHSFTHSPVRLQYNLYFCPYRGLHGLFHISKIVSYYYKATFMRLLYIVRHMYLWHSIVGIPSASEYTLAKSCSPSCVLFFNPNPLLAVTFSCQCLVYINIGSQGER